MSECTTSPSHSSSSSSPGQEKFSKSSPLVGSLGVAKIEGDPTRSLGSGIPSIVFERLWERNFVKRLFFGWIGLTTGLREVARRCEGVGMVCERTDRRNDEYQKGVAQEGRLRRSPFNHRAVDKGGSAMSGKGEC